MLERFNPALSRLKDVIYDTRHWYAPNSPSGIVASLDINEHDPSKAYVIYAGGRRTRITGEETPLLEMYEVFVDQLEKEQIKVGDYIRFDLKRKQVHRVGSPDELKDKWGIDVIAQTGWDPTVNSSVSGKTAILI